MNSTRTGAAKRIASATFTSLAVISCAAISANPVFAQQPSKLTPLPDMAPPPPPPQAPPSPANGAERSAKPDETTEPTVTIRQEGTNKIEEFRINGRHYATRVTPKVGKPYLLVDPDGKGGMSPADDVPALLRPPQWTLFQF
jgi:hypothetical protein